MTPSTTAARGARRSCFAHLGAEVSHCLPMARMPPRMTLGLPEVYHQDVADVLPYLACGEESAVYAFSGRLQTMLSLEAAAVLQRIAEEEQGHADLIAAIQSELPAAQARISAVRLAAFFQRLETAQPAVHLARVAALDWAVCKLLQPILRKGGPVSEAPVMYAALCALREDEARHVRWARDMAAQLGFDADAQNALNVDMQMRLQKLMTPVQDSLSRLKAA